jgi:hypothetical protein
MNVVQLSSRQQADRAATDRTEIGTPNHQRQKMSVAVEASLALVEASKAVVAAAGLINGLSADPRSVGKADLGLPLKQLDRQLSVLKCLHEQMKML